MRKALATLVIVGASVVGFTAVAGASSNDTLPRHWTPTVERAALVLIEQEPEFNGYDADCILDEIEDEFSNPRNFAKHASRGADSPRIVALSSSVIVNCGTESTSY